MATALPDLEFTPQRVKAIRIQLGMTQEEFAALVGVDGNMVSRWENGSRPTKGPNLKRLLEAEQQAGLAE